MYILTSSVLIWFKTPLGLTISKPTLFCKITDVGDDDEDDEDDDDDDDDDDVGEVDDVNADE